MTRFRGTMIGNRNEASRLGTTTSGLRATINGWNAGVEVDAYNTDKNFDGFSIYATSGSNGAMAREFIGTVESTEHGFIFIPA